MDDENTTEDVSLVPTEGDDLVFKRKVGNTRGVRLDVPKIADMAVRGEAVTVGDVVWVEMGTGRCAASGEVTILTGKSWSECFVDG